MKNNSTQKEVLLITNSSFAQRQWCNNEEQINANHTPEENLEEACANGMIQDLLPEVFKVNKDAKLYLWQIHPGFSFLQLELGEMPVAFQKKYSLNPHEFLPTIWLN